MQSQSQELRTDVAINIHQRIEELLSLAEDQGLGDVVRWHCVSEFKKEPIHVTEVEFAILLEKFFPLIGELAIQKIESGRLQ